MILDIINNSDYQHIIKKQIREIIEFLIKENVEFSITANIASLSFTPKLPKVIESKLPPFPLFMLAGYTFESLHTYEDYLEFEAGFGKENFGSVVKIPYLAIFQIVFDESILYINPIATQTALFENINHTIKSKSKLKLARTTNE